MSSISRVPRSREAARQTYNQLSPWYDLLAGRAEAPFRDRGLAMLDAQVGETVLEIGFGTGHALVQLAKRVGDEGYVVGIDVADGMARRASARLEEAGLRGRVGVCVGDGANRLFAEAAFDALFMSFTLELFDTPQIPVVLRHCAAMLNAQGRLAVVALSKPEEPGVPVRIYEWVHERMPHWVDCRPIFVTEVLEEAGFRVLTSETQRMWGLPVTIALARRLG